MADPMTIVHVIKMPCEMYACKRASTVWLARTPRQPFHAHACTRCALKLLHANELGVLRTDSCGHFQSMQLTNQAYTVIQRIAG